MAERGELSDALDWLHQALMGGNLNFLQISVKTLMQARHPEIRQLASAYQQRITQLRQEIRQGQREE